MSLPASPCDSIPEQTIQVARAAFPTGNASIRMRDALGPIYTNPTFAALFSHTGRPAEAPAQLALMSVRQCAAGLSDAQAADAVRARIDWKYTLALPLTDPGFDASVLATAAPDWLQSWVPVTWCARYSQRFADYRLPPERPARSALAAQIGTDGRHVLWAIYDPATPVWLREFPAIQTLRQVWLQQCYASPHDQPVRWRSAESAPSAVADQLSL